MSVATKRGLHLNRLSDMLWLIGRMLELRADATHRAKGKLDTRWSRAR
jgi:hypothetical protein